MSTCNPGDASCRSVVDGNELARRTVIKITVACALFLLLVICGLFLRRRRIRESSIGLSRISIRPPNPPKQSRVPLPIVYPAYYQSSPPHHIPQYPARGDDAYFGNPQSQGPSSIRRMPVPPAPVSPVSPRARSSVTSRQSVISRPISSIRTAPLSMHRSEPAVSAASSPASTSPRSPQRHTAGTPLPPISASPQNNPSGANPRSNPSRPPALSPMNTGMSTGILDEPPPAYTPI